jgi:CheY-like chemotaxis protein
VPAGLPRVLADPTRVHQILLNLLSNAVKFTREEGELGLEVQADEAGRNIKITVWDKGIGIKAKDVHTLFDPFTQVDSSLAREYSGTGLGLSLVDRLVRLHNGGVEVNSTFGEGSRFTVTLPWSPQNTTPIPYMRHHETRKGTGSLGQPRNSSPTKVFVVDDAEVVLQMIGDYLETGQYDVTKARSGFELMRQIVETRPDVIILDIQMPGMDGLEVIHLIRSHKDPSVAAIPIIAMTALAMSGDRERCLDAGANEYLSKPVKLKELSVIIQRLIGNKQ